MFALNLSLLSRRAGGSWTRRLVLLTAGAALTTVGWPSMAASSPTSRPGTIAVRPPAPLTPAAQPAPTDAAAPGVANKGPVAPTVAAPRANDFWYVSAATLKVWDNVGQPPQPGVVGQLPRSAAVLRLAEHDRGKDGLWFRVRTVGTNVPPVEGWVPAASLARSRGLTEGDFANLNYGPIAKRTYPNNPRRQVQALFVSLPALSSSRFQEILDIARKTSINAVVIDFKDDDGLLLLPSSAVAARMNPEAVRKSHDSNWASRVRELKAMDLYLIARIVAFKDPCYARQHPQKAVLDANTRQPYRSRDGLMWASPYDPEFRAYNLALGEEAAAAGFNEVQYDYIRFPDVPRNARLDFRSGNGQTRCEAVQSFLLEARRRLEPFGVYLAADVFGLICTTKDDMRIGQYWEAVSNAVDYICPMMYPSHYSNRNYGLPIPDQQPYELVRRGIADAIRRNRNLETPAELRPWLQGFTATWVKGYRNYGPPEVKAQVRALAENGVRSWLIWHPGGRYDIAAYR